MTSASSKEEPLESSLKEGRMRYLQIPNMKRRPLACPRAGFSRNRRRRETCRFTFFRPTAELGDWVYEGSMGEEEARSLLPHFLATIPDHRLSELEDGDILISFSSSLRSPFFSNDESINDEHTRVLSANAPSIPQARILILV